MDINAEEAELLLKRARTDRDTAVAELARLEALKVQRAGLDKFIEGLELMFPALAAGAAEQEPDIETAFPAPPLSAMIPQPRKQRPDGPPATDTVKAILRQNVGHWFTGRDVIDIFRGRDLPATDTAIRLALKRAADTGFAVREEDEDGTQRFRLNTDESGTSEAVSTS